jgi:hypothetical protein
LPVAVMRFKQKAKAGPHACDRDIYTPMRRNPARWSVLTFFYLPNRL